MDAPPIITLLTDFGDRDTFVGQMCGAIVGICPSATIIHLTHQIPPQHVLCGALHLVDAVEAFPPGTIHLGVIDPGVGSARRAVAAEIGPWRFVAPDNGLLTAIRQRWPTRSAVELNRDEWHRPVRSATFHGRDVFAPVTAHWAHGVPLEELGSPLAQPLVEIPLPVVTPLESGVRGEILWADRFGNLITSISRGNVPADVPPHQFEVTTGPHRITGLSTCFADVPAGSLLVFWGSSGRLELAVSCGSANELPGVGRGVPVSLCWPAGVD